MLKVGTFEVVHVADYLQPEDSDAMVSFEVQGYEIEFRIQFVSDGTKSKKETRSLESGPDSGEEDRGLLTFTNWNSDETISSGKPLKLVAEEDDRKSISMLAAIAYSYGVYSVRLQFMVDSDE